MNAGGAVLGHWTSRRPLVADFGSEDEEGGGSVARWPEVRLTILEPLQYGWSIAKPNTIFINFWNFVVLDDHICVAWITKLTENTNLRIDCDKRLQIGVWRNFLRPLLELSFPRRTWLLASSMRGGGCIYDLRENSSRNNFQVVPLR